MYRIVASVLVAGSLALLGSSAARASHAQAVPARGKITFSTRHYTKDGFSSTQTSFKAHTTFWWCGTYGYHVKGKLSLVISKGRASKLLDSWTSDPSYATKCGTVSVGNTGAYSMRIVLGKATVATGGFSVH